MHDSASIETHTGRQAAQGDREEFAPIPQFFPCHGGALSYLRRTERLEIAHAALPFIFHNVVDTPCQGAGNGAEQGYARHMRGQNLLIARRLVEAGVPFINVYDFKQQGQNWDSHSQNFKQHKDYLLPPAEKGLAALIGDLEDRGLLDSTLIVATGEFGRTPTINQNAGRDHWPDCYTVLLAGGGIQGGAVYGASDALGAYPGRDPATPADLAATIYWRLGFDPQQLIADRTGRPWRLADGEPIKSLFAA